jgi:alkanesulfonate monooxygenase SsuD/methylene tetrahydromethanopterin reductase-like flavin-dependent oxidoreductase (luciferase family)
VVKVGLFYLPSAGTRAEIERGMAGQNDEAYQRMLADLSDQVRLADELGYDSVAFTEHHFHIEGFEISNNPVLLDLYVAMQTRRIRVGQLGIVLPASSPLRVAEDIAMLDHMSGGRAFAGFARGYQRRWVDTLAQPYRVGATLSDESEVDRLNREAFEEFYQIVKLAWTRETFSFRGRFWTIPPEGVPWEIAATRQWGRGVDEHGRLTEIGIAPRPLQKPHPPLMQPFAFSESTIRWCAREGIMPILSPVDVSLRLHLYHAYQDEARAAGRDLAFGEGLGLLRDLVVAPTDEEARELHAKSGAFVGGAWFRPFGFDRGLTAPGEAGPLTAAQLYERGLALVGSPETVTKQLDLLFKQAPVDYLVAWQYISLLPNEVLKRSLELFATKVLPHFQ